MTDNKTQLIRALVEMASYPGEKAVPMATTDAAEVIQSQLTENTGRHLLDSGGAGGRNWEKNQDDPPWERPMWDVGDGYVVHNVYDYLSRSLDRDHTAVMLEMGLYAYGYTGPGEGDSWTACMEGFAESLPGYRDEWESLGLPPETVETLMGFGEIDRPFAENTYNGGCHSLSQCIKLVCFGGPYAEYVMVQVHGGADVRGGYTAPRVYRAAEGIMPSELFFYCSECDWQDAESVLYGEESLLYQPRGPDPFELEDEGWLAEGDEEHPALSAAYDADHIDGAVFHRCGDEPGEFGHVTFS